MKATIKLKIKDAELELTIEEIRQLKVLLDSITPKGNDSKVDDFLDRIKRQPYFDKQTVPYKYINEPSRLGEPVWMAVLA